MFADDSYDTSASCSHENPLDLNRICQMELLRTWFVANKLALNGQKIKYKLFHRLQTRVNFEGKLSFTA